MRLYCFRCLKCGAHLTLDEREVDCPMCNTPMVRDYKAEAVGNNYHPSKGNRR